MPDPEKLAKAKYIDLRVARCCGNCVSRIPTQGGLQGYCKLHKYQHTKHGPRHMPAFRYFVCSDHELDVEQMRQEAGWYAGEEWRR